MPRGPESIVIGGGIMGTATAYFLATTTNHDVTLVEKNNIAAGSTGDSSAIIRHHYGDQHQYSVLAKWSHEFYRSFEDTLGEPLAYEPNPVVRFAIDDTESAEYATAGYEVLSDLGIPVTRVEQDEFEEEYPMLDLSGVDFGVSDDTAAYSDGTDAATGFASAARRAGANILTQCEVTDVVVEDAEIREITTTDGSLSCDNLVVAAGPWSPQLAESLGVSLPVTPTREQVIILDLPDAYQENYTKDPPTSSLPETDWYLRPDGNARLLIATHALTDAVDPDDYDRSPDQETILQLADALRNYIPELSDAEISGRYCGVYSTTPDRDFILDAAGPNGCYFACGFSGHGFKHGPGVGRIMTDLVSDGHTDLVDTTPFSLNRFDNQ